MKNLIMKLIFFIAEKGKHIGINRGKLKAMLYPVYMLFCRVIFTNGGGGIIFISR